MAINELRAVATFVKAAELGSLRQAAAAQGISPQAASQALVQLEQHLGVRLFHRTTRSLSLTEEGEQFLHAAQPGLSTLQRALHGARRGREEIAGPLRIVAPRSLMLEVLWPVLEEYCRRHPQIEPDVQMDDRLSNWVEDRVDVGFRAGQPPEGGVISRRLMPLQLVVCAAPAYIAQHGAPTSIDALAQHRCSGFRHASTGKPMPWEFKVGDEVVARNITAALLSNDVELEARAVVAGQAIGQLVGTTAAPLVRAGQLVPLLTAHVADHLGLYVYYGSRSAQPSRVRAFIDLAVERLVGNTQFVLQPHELAAGVSSPPAPAARGRRRAARS
ncbi:DNA-binding transcriptional LysR family regulator [Rhodoferax ferrireducens]|uniref:DNA-binding transcriptional LysR family regulator n=1 Tax=Rhodoferax ferrireducens TaxID=192843 RepID=A0ABU2CEB0_9BURK|nr:LysR family transcriptional regulator [Rhodoferax ferrireducens]MDR7379681.1 DNA-binding transcriptional LysR family regulator [Rhodoferax ferrireducens]